MPCIDIKCDACGKRGVFQSSMRGSFGLTQIGGMMMAQGWSASVVTGKAACSDDCRAELARNVTPEVLAIEV
ncbi:hypothetical protein GGQ68_002539 [Sagittula marina]|uniref:Uncharacterized protein n=1 Tax=Sagittula marina TaxID=943940 RepID=A0A7W6DR51_9RHOB|nr:hypothetical protein [Sagittula marina]MBB3986201.1 hypothetical protein [Sagittula marina]